MQDKSAVAQRLLGLPPDKRETLRKLLEIKAAQSKSIPRRDPAERVPLTWSQQRLWIVDQLIDGKTPYNETNLIRLRFALDVDAFRRAFNEIVHRHEILRTTIQAENGEPEQHVHASLAIEIPVVDLRQLEASTREQEALRLTAETSTVPFDFEAGPLLRAALYRLDANDYLFALTMHHIICDGWSMGVLAVELSTLYWSYATGQPSPLPELPLQYGDFAVWQRKSMGRETLRPQVEYWRARLAGLASVEIPADHPRPARFTFRGSRVPVVVSGSLFTSLLALAQHNNVTPHILLLTAFFVLLHKYTGAEDLAVGMPVAGRNRRELEPLIGFFVNTLILRADISGDPPFVELLDRVRRLSFEAYGNQDVPFEQVIEELQPARDPSRNALVQVLFELFQPPSDPRVNPDLVFPFTPSPGGASKFDLSLELQWRRDELRGFVEYNVDLFDAARIERLASHFECLLHSILEDPRRKVSELNLLPEHEKRRLLVDFNATASPYPRDSNIVAAFMEQRHNAPARPAADFAGETITYSELAGRAGAIAAALLARGVKPGDAVGLFMERCVELPAAMLGTLATGAFYVPLDPGYPDERLAFLLADSGARVCVTTAGFEERLAPLGCASVVAGHGAGESVALETVRIDPTDVACLYYTSGTTGKPKGVAITHRNILRLVKVTGHTRIDRDDTVLHFAPITFDASAYEIWGPLLNGAKVAIHPQDVPSLDALGAFIRNSRVSLLFITTSLFRYMVAERARDLRDVKRIITGGEVLPPDVARSAWRELPRTRLFNAYGPTECATFSTIYPMNKPDAFAGGVPIGKPLDNTTVYILDGHGNPVSLGAAGEIFIGGDGVARGYWNRPDLTEKSFVPDRFGNPEGKLYRTGDSGRYRPDGDIEFLGRRDRQIKLSGYRIELAEIEHAIVSCPGISGAAAVVVRGEGEPHLAAFAECAPGTDVSADELRRRLSAALPQYMVPGHVEVLENLPLTASGKIDLPALERRAASSHAPPEGFVAPRTPAETLLAGIWKEVLHIDRVGVTDDFFALGGQSLVATRLLSRIRNTFQTTLTMREFFEQPTIAGLAAVLARDPQAIARAELLAALDTLAPAAAAAGAPAPVGAPPSGGPGE